MKNCAIRDSVAQLKLKWRRFFWLISKSEFFSTEIFLWRKFPNYEADQTTTFVVKILRKIRNEISYVFQHRAIVLALLVVAFDSNRFWIFFYLGRLACRRMDFYRSFRWSISPGH